MATDSPALQTDATDLLYTGSELPKVSRSAINHRRQQNIRYAFQHFPKHFLYLTVQYLF
jgi:hypothetical protein